MQICYPFQDLQEFLDGAEHGAILFTMGFVFQSSFVPKERIETLFAVFARLPQRVVMRLDAVPDNTPDNVLIKPFLPQQVSAQSLFTCGEARRRSA